MFKALIHDMPNEDICKPFQGEDGKNHNIFTYCIKFESIEIFDLLIEERRLYQDGLLHMALNHRVDGVGNLLHATIEFDSQEMLQHLLENHRGLITPLMTQVNFEFSFDDEYSGLIPPQLAAARKNEFAFTHILKTFPELVNSPNIHGFNRTVSHTAAYFKFDWGIQRLYQNANFDSRDAGGSTVKDLLKDSALYRSLIAAEQQIDQIGPSLSFLPPENLVFSGGGPRGLAYVGALAALENVNDTNLINGVKRVCGTSAGAITAALLACGFNSEKLSAFSEKTPLNSLLDFDDRLPTRHREFLESEEFNAILRDNTPEKIPEKLAKVEGMHQFKKGVAVAGRAAIDAVGHIQEIVDPETREEKLRELSLKFMRFIHGIYSGEFVERVVDKTQEILIAINNCAIRGFCKGEKLRIAIEQAIREETGIENCTFGELVGLIKKSPNRFKHLYLYGTNIHTGKPELFSSEEERCKDIIISDAIRISMSIPVVFQPHGVFYKRERARIQSGEKIYVDGGLLRNFPIRDFDDKRYLYSGISTKSGPHSDTHIFNRRTMGFKFTEETNPQHGPNNRPTLSSSLSGIAALYYSAEQHLCENQVDPRIISINPGKAGLLSFHMDKKEQTILINQGRQDTEKHIRASQATGYSSSRLERPRTPRARQRSTKLQSPLSLRLSPFQESSLLSKINTFVSVLILTNRNRSSTSALHTQLPIVFNPGGMQDMSQENTLVVSAIQNLGFLNPLKVETSIKDFLNRNFSVDDLVSLKLIADRVKMLFSACSDLLENAESQEDQGELVVRTVINFESWTVLRSIMAAFESRVLTLEKDVAQLENRELRAKDKRKDRVIEEDKLKRKELHLENKELHQKVERLEKTRESSSTTRKELHPSKIEEMCLKTRTDAEKRIYELSSIRCDLDKLFVGLFSPGKIKKPTSFVCALHGEPETVLFKPQTPHEKKFYIKLTTLQDSAKIRNILDDLLKLKLTETSGYEDYESYIAKQAWDLINAEFNSKNNRREFPDIFVPNGLLAFKKSNIILSEMKYMLKTSTHVALNEELIQHEVKLAVPLEWDGHIGRNWWAVEDRNFPKTCYEKMVEIVSIVLARQWIQEKNEWLQNSLNYFENPSAYSKRYFAPNKQPVSKDILLGANRLFQMIKEDDAVKYFGAYTIKEVFSHLELIAFGNEEKIFKTLPKRQYGKSLDKDQLLSFFIDCFKREKHHDRDHIRRAIDKDVESILTNPPNQVMSLFKRTFEQEDGYRKGDFWRLNSFVHVLLRDFPEIVANKVISNLDKYGVSFEKDEQKEKIPELIRACVQVELCHFMISALK